LLISFALPLHAPAKHSALEFAPDMTAATTPPGLVDITLDGQLVRVPTGPELSREGADQQGGERHFAAGNWNLQDLPCSRAGARGIAVFEYHTYHKEVTPKFTLPRFADATARSHLW